MTKVSFKQELLSNFKQLREGIESFAQTKDDIADGGISAVKGLRDGVDGYYQMLKMSTMVAGVAVKTIDAVYTSPKYSKMAKQCVSNAIQDLANRAQELVNVAEAVITDNEVCDAWVELNNAMKARTNLRIVETGQSLEEFKSTIIDHEGFRDLSKDDHLFVKKHIEDIYNLNIDNTYVKKRDDAWYASDDFSNDADATMWLLGYDVSELRSRKPGQ